jgi:hypothetical protein
MYDWDSKAIENQSYLDLICNSTKVRIRISYLKTGNFEPPEWDFAFATGVPTINLQLAETRVQRWRPLPSLPVRGLRLPLVEEHGFPDPILLPR